MDHLPSKYALFLTRVMNFISGFVFVAGLTSLCQHLLPWWASLPVSAFAWGTFGVCVYTISLPAFVQFIGSRNRFRNGFGRDRSVPSYWQLKWNNCARVYGFQRGKEWYPTIAAVATFVLYTLMVALDFKFMPQIGTWSWFILVNTALVSCYTGTFTYMFGCTGFGQKPKPGPDGGWLPDGSDPTDPDDNGPAGMGARLRPPTPVIDITERRRA